MTAAAAPDPAPDRPVIELACGVTVYLARRVGGRWRAVWYEAGQRRQCEAASEDRLAVKLEKVTEIRRASSRLARPRSNDGVP